jgi:hypothetical protein
MFAVMVFMLIYYRGSGINADLALFLNLVILLGFMGFSHATYSAGYRRSHSDHRYGRRFERADLRAHSRRDARRQRPSAGRGSGLCARLDGTIFDTHVTTIVSAAILFMFGTGPVKGFATTLVFGLARQPVHRGLCLAGDLRFACEPQAGGTEAFDLSDLVSLPCRSAAVIKLPAGAWLKISRPPAQVLGKV